MKRVLKRSRSERLNCSMLKPAGSEINFPAPLYLLHHPVPELPLPLHYGAAISLVPPSPDLQCYIPSQITPPLRPSENASPPTQNRDTKRCPLISTTSPFITLPRSPLTRKARPDPVLTCFNPPFFLTYDSPRIDRFQHRLSLYVVLQTSDAGTTPLATTTTIGAHTKSALPKLVPARG